MSDFIQHIIIDDTLKRIGETVFTDYLCHAYCHDGFLANNETYTTDAASELVKHFVPNALCNFDQGYEQTTFHKLTGAKENLVFFCFSLVYSYLCIVVEGFKN